MKLFFFLKKTISTCNKRKKNNMKIIASFFVWKLGVLFDKDVFFLGVNNFEALVHLFIACINFGNSMQQNLNPP